MPHFLRIQTGYRQIIAKRKLSGIHFPPPQLSSHVQALHVFPLSGHFNRPKNFLGLP
jgi:hypothetical protein